MIGHRLAVILAVRFCACAAHASGLAGSLSFLSASSLVLWWEMHRRKVVGLAIFAVSVAATVAIAVSLLQLWEDR
jgi:hypothetical protein